MRQKENKVPKEVIQRKFEEQTLTEKISENEKVLADTQNELLIVKKKFKDAENEIEVSS